MTSSIVILGNEVLMRKRFIDISKLVVNVLYEESNDVSV